MTCRFLPVSVDSADPLWDGERMPPEWQNRLRFVLALAGDGDQQTEADRLVALGATRLSLSQADASAMLMADPDGREFYPQTAR